MGASRLIKETRPVRSEETKVGQRGLALNCSAANLSSEKQILQQIHNSSSIELLKMALN